MKPLKLKQICKGPARCERYSSKIYGRLKKTLSNQTTRSFILVLVIQGRCMWREVAREALKSSRTRACVGVWRCGGCRVQPASQPASQRLSDWCTGALVHWLSVLCVCELPTASCKLPTVNCQLSSGEPGGSVGCTMDGPTAKTRVLRNHQLRLDCFPACLLALLW